MNLLKKILLVLVFLLIVVLAWVGTSIYWQRASLDIDQDATSYTKPLNETFNKDTLTDISQKTLESFPVSPQEFLRLNQD